MSWSFKVCDVYSEASNTENEDLAGFLPEAAWVLDGATALGCNHVISKQSDATCYVKAIDAELKTGLRRLSDNVDVRDTLKQSIENVRNALKRSFSNYKVAPFELPSSSMALVRIRNTRELEWTVLGDCKILVRSGNETRLYVENSRLEALDAIAIEELKRKVEAGSPNPVQEPSVQHILKKNRASMNTPNGYWTLSFSTESIDNAYSGQIEIEEIDDILMMTDGFFRLIDPFKKYTPKSLMAEVERSGLRKATAKLRRLEKEDASLSNYPRFKISDDATAIWLKPIQR